MKALILTLALISPAAAQSPGRDAKRIYLHDNATGQPVGSVTQWQNKFTLRDAKGDFIGTIVVEPGGKRTFYDPDGKEAQMPTSEVRQ